MRIHHCLTALFLLSFLQGNAQWNLVWSDEFNGTAIDPANWAFETGGNGWGNNELENYTNRPVNATVSNGNLLIIAKKENFGGNSYTSARMKTQGLHSWTYGKIEASLKFPSGKGYWPAFWMLGDTISTAGWPQCGEIDIMEHINTDTTVEGTMHWYNNGAASYGLKTAWKTNQFHTYAVEWDAGSIKWMMDGVLYMQGNIANNINNTNAFQHPFFILLNLAVGGTWPGSPDVSTSFPDTLFVDYVRVYAAATTLILKQPDAHLGFNISPNPVSHNAVLELTNAKAGICQIEVSDMSGRICLNQTSPLTSSGPNQIPLVLEDLKPGLYIVNLKNEGLSGHLKIIRQNH